METTPNMNTSSREAKLTIHPLLNIPYYIKMRFDGDNHFFDLLPHQFYQTNQKHKSEFKKFIKSNQDNLTENDKIQDFLLNECTVSFKQEKEELVMEYYLKDSLPGSNPIAIYYLENQDMSDYEFKDKEYYLTKTEKIEYENLITELNNKLKVIQQEISLLSKRRDEVTTSLKIKTKDLYKELNSLKAKILLEPQLFLEEAKMKESYLNNLFGNMFNSSIVLEGHTEIILKVIDLNNETFASCSQDKTIKIWDSVNGKCLKTLNGHKDGVSSLLLLEENILASSGLDKLILIWNISSEQIIRTLTGHKGDIFNLCKLDKTYLASCSSDKKIIIWDYSNGEIIKTLNGHNDLIRALIYNSEDNLIISCSDDLTIKLWDIESGECKKSYSQLSKINSIYPIGNGLIVSCNSDNTIKIINIYNGECCKSISGHDINTFGLCRLNSDYYATGGEDHLIKIWNLRDGKTLKELKGHTYDVFSLCLTMKNKLVSASWDNTIRIWQ